jgi:cell division protein FtsN
MDYKHRATGERPRRPVRRDQPRRGWIIALALILAGVAGASGWMAYQRAQTQAPQAEAQTPPTATSAGPDKKTSGQGTAQKTPETAKSEPPKRPEPRFTFYKILPEKEVIIPEDELKNLKQAESTAAVKPASQYVLQAGSFTDLEDAKKLKARLSQVNIKARIENVKIEDLSWYRVKIGPFKTLEDVDSVRAHLRANQIDSVVQKATGK